jgi:hypothetical protein
MKIQVIDIKLVTRILGEKNGLHRVGGVGGSGFFGEETTNPGRGNGCGWRVGMSRLGG